MRERSAHPLALQRRVVLALALVQFADDAQLGEVAQLRVDRELTELIVGLGKEIGRMRSGCDPVPLHCISAPSQQTPETTRRTGKYPNQATAPAGRA